jgi:hypothetical protein
MRLRQEALREHRHEQQRSPGRLGPGHSMFSSQCVASRSRLKGPKHPQFLAENGSAMHASRLRGLQRRDERLVEPAAAEVVDLVAVGSAHEMQQLVQDDEEGESGVTRDAKKPPVPDDAGEPRGNAL